MRPQQQAPADRPQLVRQEDEWSLPPMLREEMMQRGNRQHKCLPQLSLLLLQRKDYLPTGAVKVLQEKELLSEYSWLEV